MPYGWHTEAIMLQSHHFMEYPAFIKIINTFKFKQFSVKAVRDTMKSTLENLIPNFPVTVAKRFPADRIYIDLHHSVPMRIMRQITMALDYSDRQGEKGRNHTDSVDIRAYSNMEDAKVAFYSAVDQILDLVGPLEVESSYVFGVYTQGSFEEQHRLIWTD